MLSLLELNHVALTTGKVEASVRFYCDVLGFRELRRPAFSFGGAWLRGAGVTLHLIESPGEASGEAAGHENPPLSSRRNHLAFAVKDVGAVKQLLQQRGIPFLEQVNAGGAHQIFLRDPAGHHIELAVYPLPAGAEPLADNPPGIS